MILDVDSFQTRLHDLKVDSCLNLIVHDRLDLVMMGNLLLPHKGDAKKKNLIFRFEK